MHLLTALARPPLGPRAALLALALAACGGEGPAPQPAAGADGPDAAPSSEGGAPDLGQLQVAATEPEANAADIDAALQAPDPSEVPDLAGIVLTQELPAASGRPDPSLERLEPRTEWGGVTVEFYEAAYPSGDLRLQGHRTLAAEGESVLHGPEWRWYENGQLARRRVFDLGKVDGPVEEWHESGIKKVEGRFDHDFATGRWIRWNALGAVWKVSDYANGSLDGMEYVFHPEEGSLSQRTLWANGKKEGEELVWTKSGQPSEVNGWKAGKRHGERRQWYGDGQLGLEATFVDGKRNGPFTQYWQSGKPHLRGQLDMGTRIGEWRQWSEDGRLEALENYVDGKYDGLVQRWNSAEILVFEGEFSAGQGVGMHTEFYDGGGPKTQQVYVDGVPDGKKTTWHPNGVKASEGVLKDGQREGEWTLWGEDGERLEAWSGRYENGVKVDE